MSQPTLAPDAAQVMTGHPDAMANVPTDAFVLADLSAAESKRLVKRLADSRALSTEFITTDDGVEVVEYELTEMGKARRKAVIDSGYRPLPCDHVGLRNIDGTTFECCWDACSRTFDRSEVDLDA
ncbi:hypothetical protein [Haloarcula argentinensis]|uniref:Uncharacterized protein n=1 Tax=Haloarcula argentinensis TaxID=43776 RepID=A0A830FRY9_HALAR|nr:hypothetical protein [Haloarcula argentinensis]GGM52630.1 hypothetical protein GCM10009006_37220 [Haloarcula argentinensis]